MDEIRQQINESSTIESLVASLGSSNEREVSYALDMLSGVDNVMIIDPLRSLLVHKSDEIRLSVLRLLIPIDNSPVLADVIELIDNPNSDIRIEAMHYLLVHSTEDSNSMISHYLDHTNLNYRTTALCCIAEYGDDKLKTIVNEEHIVKLLNDKSSSRPEILYHVARALGSLRNRDFRKYFD